MPKPSLPFRRPLSAGVANVTVQVGSIDGNVGDLPMKITNLKDLHEFRFFDGYMVAKMVPGVGEGLVITVETNIEVPTIYKYQIMGSRMTEDSRPEKHTRKKFFEGGKVEKQPYYNCEEDIKATDQPVFESGSIFTCDKNDYCTCQFLTFNITGMDSVFLAYFFIVLQNCNNKRKYFAF